MKISELQDGSVRRGQEEILSSNKVQKEGQRLTSMTPADQVEKQLPFSKRQNQMSTSDLHSTLKKPPLPPPSSKKRSLESDLEPSS